MENQETGLATRHTEHKRIEFKGFPRTVPSTVKEDEKKEDKLFLLLLPKKVEELTVGDNEKIAVANLIIATRIRENALLQRPDYPGQGIW